MEANYIKTNVGPVLTQALTSLVLHVPLDSQPSSFSSTLDPVSYIGHYLIAHATSVKNREEFERKKQASEKFIAQWKETQQREKQTRLRLEESLNARISLRRTVIDAQLEAETAAAAPLPPVEEPNDEAGEAAEGEEAKDGEESKEVEEGKEGEEARVEEEGEEVKETKAEAQPEDQPEAPPQAEEITENPEEAAPPADEPAEVTQEPEPIQE
ncbi:hypothetical protein HK103_003426 [Boothiomyces macroporosus]|uniref:Uncharacterized protein n=1 Tax=Boothiomyces macroporosus TaxID=261099 RepID=A0AAD5UIR6_9FUNG|nr:hypothetical protein HK103_003426 [Boothiomyces macroporosus]